MKAGRELDALVAEKVMGRNLTLEKELTEHEMWLSQLMPEIIIHIPHYSTDIAAAWEVVEKVRTLESIEQGVAARSQLWRKGSDGSMVLLFLSR